MDIKQNPTYKELLAVMQNLDELGGVSSTEEYIAIMRELTQETIRRANTATKSWLQNKLSVKTREELVSRLTDHHKSGMFGDGIEWDYIDDGVYIQGLNNSSDDELVDMYDDYMNSTEDELLATAKAELATHNMLEK